MLLNPYQFKKYLRPSPADPTVGGWVVSGFFLALLTLWAIPFIAPDAVALALPSTPTATLKSPPSAFAVYTSSGIIYNNRLMTLSGFWEAIRTLETKDTLLIATEGQTPLHDLLPILETARAIGFREVAFTVKP